MRAILKRVGRLAWLAASGPGAWAGLGLFALILALEFFGVWVSVRMIAWSKAFYDALEQMDAGAALAQILVFAQLVAMAAGSDLGGSWLRKRLQIDLRQRLTARALDLWLTGGAYWHLRPGLSAAPVDNPDQRLAEDCSRFIDDLLDFSIDLIARVVALVTYLGVLWGLSNFPLALSVLGVDVTIPRYMIWAAFAYVFLSSLMTHWLGRPLKVLSFRQERHEADFRHALVQVRDGADPIALAGGEAAERRRLDHRFGALRENWRALIGRQFVLGLFTHPYRFTVLRIPTFLALPAYFGGAVTLGGLMQTASAFSNVTTTLSWFIFQYHRLAAFVAVSERLEGLFDAATAPTPVPDAPRAIVRGGSGDGTLRLAGVHLFTPQGRGLHPLPDAVIEPGERIWLRGASGQGKTTLLSALRGIWPYGRGQILLPQAPLMILPQVPVSFGEGVLATLTYPHDPASYAPGHLESVLAAVGLALRPGVADGPAALQGLSMGERQRLALGRALLLRPAWLLMDEATSALDPASEAVLLAQLRRALPGAAILCVAHRPPLGLNPDRELVIGPDESERKSA